jgi:hypothetical protein
VALRSNDGQTAVRQCEGNMGSNDRGAAHTTGRAEAAPAGALLHGHTLDPSRGLQVPVGSRRPCG